MNWENDSPVVILNTFPILSLPHLCVWLIVYVLYVEQAGGTEQLLTFHSDEDYNVDYVRTVLWMHKIRFFFLFYFLFPLLFASSIFLKADETSRV